MTPNGWLRPFSRSTRAFLKKTRSPRRFDLESILFPIDEALFRAVNQGWSHPLLDRFFSFVTQYKNFLPVLVPGLVLLLWKGGPKGRWFVLALGLAVLAADQSASHLVKPWVERVRPCNALEEVLTPAGKSSSLSFPSSHAANMGAILVVIALTYGKWAWWFLPLGLASGLSRIYLGLHYPFDVLGGYFLGGLLGWAVWWWIEWIQGALEKKRQWPRPGTRKPKRVKKRGAR